MRKVALNLVSVIGGELLLRVANFAAVVVIARLYGASVLGIYATVLAFVTVAVMIADNGLQVSTIKEIAQKPGMLDDTLGQLYVAKSFLFFLMTVFLVALGMGMKFPQAIWLMGGFIALRTMLYSYCQLHAGVLKALDRMPLIGMVQVVHCGLLLAGVGLAFYRSWTVTTLLGWLLLCQTFEMVASGAIIFRLGIRPRWSSFSGSWQVLSRSTPIGVTYSVAALILRADVIVLSWIVAAREVGYFAAANIPLVMVYVVSWLLGGVILPQMLALVSDPSAMREYSHRWIRLLLVVAVPVCLLQFMFTPQLIQLLYGPEFASTGRLAAIMGLAVPFILANSVWLSRAIACGSIASYLVPYIATGLLALLLDYGLGREFRGLGIAVAIVIREAVMFAVFAAIQMRPAGVRKAGRNTTLSNSLMPAPDPSGNNLLP
jgi:O-antigen/teichoic acid export membrane protein